MTKYLMVLVSTLAFAASARAADFIVDPLTLPSGGQSVDIVPTMGSPTGTSVDAAAANVLGGRRDLAIFNENGLGMSGVSVAAFPGGAFELQNSARATGEGYGLYGFDSTSPGGYAFAQDFSRYTGFKLSGVFSSVNTTYDVILESTGGEIEGKLSAGPTHGGALVIPFSAFTGPAGFDIHKVNALYVAATTTQGGGAVEIGSFAATRDKGKAAPVLRPDAVTKTAPAATASLSLDPFDQPSGGQSVSIVPIMGTPTGTSVDDAAADALGGRRLLSIFNENGLGTSTVSIDTFPGGAFELQNSARATGQGYAEYGFSSTSPGGYAFSEDLSGFNAIELHDVTTSVATTFTIILESNGGQVTGRLKVGANDGSDLIIPFSSLGGRGASSFDIKGVDAVVFAATTTDQGGAVEVGSLSVVDVPGARGMSVAGSRPLAVPEPATWATMLLGVAGLGSALRRRRAPATA